MLINFVPGRRILAPLLRCKIRFRGIKFSISPTRNCISVARRCSFLKRGFDHFEAGESSGAGLLKLRFIASLVNYWRFPFLGVVLKLGISDVLV